MGPALQQRRNEPIAIIGTGCRFPGANNPAQLWDLLEHPRDVQSPIPSDHFSTDGFYHPSHDNQGTSHTRHGYFLSSDHRHFDAEFFGIKPVEAKSMDPQQRLLLEVVYESIEAAGLDMQALRGSPTAVYVGLMAVDYSDMLNRDTSDYPSYVAAGTARSMISNRLSYFFDWRGPSMTIDTACSSSMVALHLAVQSLRAGESKLAIAAGANLLLGPEQFIAGSTMKMLSPHGRSYWCDDRANGYARGEGIAAIVLKPLSAAIADGDDIECVIAETGLNQDGRTQGLTVPSAAAQASLIRATYEKAGLDLTQQSDRPQYFEAHGTGTPTGDPIEVKAIQDAFFASVGVSQDKSGLYCGSIKTIIGHTEGTAGMAGLIKTSMALRYGVIPPNLLLQNLAPAVKPFLKSLEIPTTAQPWPTLVPGSVRRASVNSFGFGGANAHCILESFAPTKDKAIVESTSHHLFVFSATSEESLVAVLKAYAEYLDSHPTVDLRALSHTLFSRRTTFSARVSFSAKTLRELRTKMDSVTSKTATNLFVTAPVSVNPPRILGIFTGQGAQWAGMASRLMQLAGAIAVIGELERSLAELPDPPSWSLQAELSKLQSCSRVTEAAIAQPACTAIQILLVKMLRAAGIHFSAVVGHSSGEIAASYAAGYLSARDAIRIAYYRGVHLDLVGGKNGESGAMIAVGASYEEAQNLCNRDEFCGRICVAASNSASSVTLSGDSTAVDEMETLLKAQNRFARRLRVDNAYHSHHMLRCSAAITASLRACGIKSQRPDVPKASWISSVYHRDIVLVTDNLDDEYWHRNTVGVVMFSQALEHALQQSHFDLAVEIGAHPALKGPALQVIEAATGHFMPYTGTLDRKLEDNEAFANTLGYVWANTANSDVNLASFDRFMIGEKSPMLLKGLPTYSWNHGRTYWHESRTSRAYRNRCGRHELLGFRSTDYSDDQVSWKNNLIPEQLPWIQDHRIQGQMIFPGAAYVVSAFEAALQIAEERSVGSVELSDFVFGQPLVFAAEESRLEVLISLHDIRRQGPKTTAKFTYHSIASEASGPMTLNAHCQLSIDHGDADVVTPQSIAGTQFGMQEVESERIYDSFANRGYQYAGLFRALTSVSRRLGIASGLIRMSETYQGTTSVIHPATLDAAIHSILVAHSYPDDGRLSTLLLPTGVQKIRLHLSAAKRCSSHQHLKFVSRSIDEAQHTEGGVELWSMDDANAVLQLEGLRTKPIVPASPANDVHMFSETVWGLASPILSNHCDGSSASRDVFDFMVSATEQLSHRYPGMRILSIGGSNPGRTTRFVSRLNNAFASYMHTNPSEEGLDLDRTALEALDDKTTYKVLDPTIDVGDQGFSAQLFDLVVAFSPSFRGLAIGQIVRNARRLLRPGGYFLCPQSVDDLLAGGAFLEHGEFVSNSGRSALPSRTDLQRRRELEGYGFADVSPLSSNGNTEFDPTHSSLTFVQAVDDRIRFLRDPLSGAVHYPFSPLEDITVIGGETSLTSLCANRITEVLQSRSEKMNQAKSISSLATVEPPFDSSNIIVLQDHDKPLFESFDQAGLQGLQRLFATSKNIIWVTYGYKRNAPHARMLVAFARCLLQEMAHVRLQILDFPSPDALDAEAIVREFLKLKMTAVLEEQGCLSDILWSVEPEIAYENGHALIPRVKPSIVMNDRYNSTRRMITQNVIANNGDATVQIRVQPVDHKELFKGDRTYWLAGLTGDLGLSLCQWMITKGAGYIALSSRSPKVDPAWLGHFQSLGATVQILSCDVTDYASVEATLAHINTSMPSVAGVCHGAMVLQDALFQDLDIARVKQVLSPKVNGAINLDRVLRSHSLDFFVMLSSVAATTGNPGQSIYAAANGFLAGLAATRRARGECASTINLGAIIGTGVTRNLTVAQQKALRNAGVMWTSEQDFHTGFAEAVVASRPCEGGGGEFHTGVRVCDADEQLKPKHASSPVFSHMVSHSSSQGHSTSSGPSIESARARLLRATKEEEVVQVLQEFLTTKLRKALQMSEDSPIIDKTADALGVDSLIAVEMRSWLLKELGVDLPLLIIIGGNIMRQVLEACRERIDPALTPLLQASEGLAAGSEVQREESYKGADAPAARQTPVMTAYAQSGEIAGVVGIESADDKDETITNTIQDAPSAPALEHISKRNPVPTDEKPVPGSVLLSNSTPSKRGSPQARSPNRHDLLHEADSNTSSSDSNDYGGSARAIETKAGSIGVRTVSGGSPGGSTQSREKTKRRGLLGRLIRSRGFVNLRRYV